MKIVFFSYEYPPETGGGGIGTYLAQCVYWLPKFGHQVVVIAGTQKEEAFWEYENVYRIPCTKYTYNDVLLDYFIPLHKAYNFDVAEGTDYMTWGLPILKQIKDLPFCVKAHTAGYIVNLYLYQPLTILQKLRFIAGAIKRTQWPTLPKGIREEDFLLEKEIVSKADLVISPSVSLGNKYTELGWTNKFEIVPYIFNPTFEIFPKKESEKLTITFFGRLEIRKGILDIIKAIPKVLEKHPSVVFKFVGAPSASPKSGVLMDAFIKLKLTKYLNHIEISPPVPNAEINKVLADGDIFIMPSRYDNFPLACMEAMAAGKAVIGSRSGGMAEIIVENVSGLLVNPNKPKQLAEKIILLIENKELREKISKNAPIRVKEMYHPEVIVPMQIAAYQLTIENHKKCSQ